MDIVRLHHIAVICSNYELSKKFYTEILGFKVRAGAYRKERDSYKLDLDLNNDYLIELFSFPNPPDRPTQPEARGLRHLAFQVSDLDEAIKHLERHNVEVEPIRVDEYTHKRFTFFYDPDKLPLELYEA